MEYPVLHRCGHEQRHAIYRMFAAEADREVERLARRICTACWRDDTKATDRHLTGQATHTAGAGSLTRLIGTPKQVAWAEKIRGVRIASRQQAGHDDTALLVSVADAKWWIDNRKRVVSDLLALLTIDPLKTDEATSSDH